MKISMLMPVYNCPWNLLHKAILSVIYQTHKDTEIVIQDGCVAHPAIRNPQIMDLFELYGDQIVYYVQEDSRDDEKKRSGFYQALNRCMQCATGDVFSFLAGDDERGPIDVLSKVNERFEQHGSTPFLLYGDCEKINLDSSSDIVVPPGMFRPVSNPLTFEDLLTDNMLCTPSVFWNRAVYEKFGLFDETLDWAADYEYWLRIWRGIDKEYLPGILGRYRVWGTSQNAKNGEAAHQQGLEAKKRYS